MEDPKMGFLEEGFKDIKRGLENLSAEIRLFQKDTNDQMTALRAQNDFKFEEIRAATSEHQQEMLERVSRLEAQIGMIKAIGGFLLTAAIGGAISWLTAFSQARAEREKAFIEPSSINSYAVEIYKATNHEN